MDGDLLFNIYVQVDEGSDRLATDALQQESDVVHEAPKLHKGARKALLNAMDSDEDG